MCAYAIVDKDNARATIRRYGLNQLVKIISDIVQRMCVARLLSRPAFAGVSWRSALPVAIVCDHPWLRGETRLLNEINSRLPNGLWESKAIKEDDKKVASCISFEELIRDRIIRLGRESYGWHFELAKCLGRFTKLARRTAVTDDETSYGVRLTYSKRRLGRWIMVEIVDTVLS
jgi:hypothetical protein